MEHIESGPYRISLTPTVTVAIPTYKGAAHLPAAIDSVLGQSFTDIELLIVDDRSPDDTQAIVESYSDPRLRYSRNTRNIGPEGNWNRCLDLAQGRYFKLLPHDDVLSPTCLEQQVAALESDHAHEIALVFAARNVLKPDGTVVLTRKFPGSGGGRISATKVLRTCVRRGTNLIGEPGAVLFRTSLARDIGPFDAANPYVIDLDYWFRLLQRGDAYYCAEVLAGFRLSQTSWSVAIGTSQARDFRMLIERAVFGATDLDRFFGRIAARANNLARLLFYRLLLR